MPITDPPRQTLYWLAVAALLGWGLYELRGILTPFIAAAILAYALAPAVDRLERLKLPRMLAAALVMVAAVLTLGALMLILLPVIQNEYRQIRTQLPTLAAAVSGQVIPWVQTHLGLSISLDGATIRDWLSAQMAGSTQDLLAALMQHARSGWAAAVEIIGLLVMVPVLLFYLLADWPRLTTQIHALIPRRWAATSSAAMTETDSLLGQYLRGQLLVMLALAVWYCGALLVAGLDQWLALGVLTGVLAFIPYLGFGAGLLFSLIAAMLQLGIAQGALTVGIIFGIGQLLEGYWLTPRLVGERIGLHPVAVLFALLAFGTIFGFAGVLLALPLAAAALVVLRRLRNAWLDSDFYRRP